MSESTEKSKMVDDITDRIQKMDKIGLIKFIAELFTIINDKCAERDKARAEAARLEKMLMDARIALLEAQRAFERYADIHERKGDAEKQARNAALAGKMRDAIAATDPVAGRWVGVDALAAMERELDAANTDNFKINKVATGLFDELKRRERAAPQAAQDLISNFSKLSTALAHIPGARYAVQDVRDAVLRAMNLAKIDDEKKEGGL